MANLEIKRSAERYFTHSKRTSYWSRGGYDPTQTVRKRLVLAILFHGPTLN